MNKVFISHKSDDSNLATTVSDYIKQNGLETYLDIIDDVLLQDGPELPDAIRERMNSCNQLVAVVSEKTKRSWWVPWEIGVGTEKDFLIASYSQSAVELPSYLKKWPQLHSKADIDQYCRRSLEVASNLRIIAFESHDSEGLGSQPRISSGMAKSFHQSLKRDLGQ